MCVRPNPGTNDPFYPVCSTGCCYADPAALQPDCECVCGGQYHAQGAPAEAKIRRRLKAEFGIDLGHPKAKRKVASAKKKAVKCKDKSCKIVHKAGEQERLELVIETPKPALKRGRPAKKAVPPAAPAITTELPSSSVPQLSPRGLKRGRPAKGAGSAYAPSKFTTGQDVEYLDLDADKWLPATFERTDATGRAVLTDADGEPKWVPKDFVREVKSIGAEFQAVYGSDKERTVTATDPEDGKRKDAVVVGVKGDKVVVMFPNRMTTNFVPSSDIKGTFPTPYDWRKEAAKRKEAKRTNPAPKKASKAQAKADPFSDCPALGNLCFGYEPPKASKHILREIAETPLLGKSIASSFSGNPVPGSIATLASAKVLHSVKAAKWVNAVVYMAPSDNGFLPLAMRLGWDVARKIHDSVAWEPIHTTSKAFDALKAKVLSLRNKTKAEVMQLFRDKKRWGGKNIKTEFVERRGLEPWRYLMPYAPGRFGLNACPFASPKCRATCLNTSGQGGAFGQAGGDADLPFGWTKTDDWQLALITTGKFPQSSKGVEHYGPLPTTSQGARLLRLHLMWMSWGHSGSMYRNRFVDAMLVEALGLIDKAAKAAAKDKVKSYPVAWRTNGTGDYPVHKFETTDGRNFVLECNRAGIVCYDYTKDYRKMLAWLESGAWSGDWRDGVGKNAGIVNGWPKGYHLTFSAAENNLPMVCRVLKAGGNVTMVMRRSVTANQLEAEIKELIQGFRSGQRNRILVGETFESLLKLKTIPKAIDLSGLPGGQGLDAVPCVDADSTDLRFTDPHRAGPRGMGCISALSAKGWALVPYDATGRDAWWSRFVQAVSNDDPVTALPPNPAPTGADRAAVAELDPDLIVDVATDIGPVSILPTGMGC